MAILHNKVALGTGVVAIPSVSLVSLWRRCMVGSSWNKVAFITKNELDKGFSSNSLPERLFCVMPPTMMVGSVGSIFSVQWITCRRLTPLGILAMVTCGLNFLW